MFVNEVSTIWTEKVHDYKVPKSEVRRGWRVTIALGPEFKVP